MNLDYLFLHLPDVHRTRSRTSGPTAWACRVLFTSPGLLLAVLRPVARPPHLAPAARRRPRPDPDAALLRRRLAPVRLPLLPRLDPVRLGARARSGSRASGQVPWWGWTLILWSVLMGMVGVYWAYNLH